MVGAVSVCINPETESHASQACLELLALRTPPRSGLGYRCSLPQLVSVVLGIEPRASCMLELNHALVVCRF